MSGHTPGPWKADRNLGCKRISAKPYEQHRQAKRMEVACTPGLYSEEEDAANARLIAAAPDLLEALQAAIECGIVPKSSAAEGGALRHSRQVQVADMVRAAIAKAENGHA